MKRPELSDKQQWLLSVLAEYEGRLTRFAARMLGDVEAARDVVQHAFLKLCDRSPEEVGDRTGQWLFTVCRNRAVDTLRSRRQTVSLDTAGVGRFSKEPDPAAVAERQDLYLRLSGLVTQLPPAQRETVDLWSEGFSYRQIAEITDRSEGNVRVLVHRALKTLRETPLAKKLLDEAADTNQPPHKSTERV